MSLNCTTGELEKFTGEDVTNGIKEFLKRKVVPDEVSVSFFPPRTFSSVNIAFVQKTF